MGTNREYGVSVVSLFPWSLGANGLQRSIEMARAAGFDGVQALPMRGWKYEGLSQLLPFVLSYEDAWNSGSWFQMILRHLGRLPKGPTIEDKLLFGRKHMCLPDIPFCAHTWDVEGEEDIITTDDLIEINPDLSTSPAEYLEKYYEGFRFCWDTKHVRRDKYNGQSGIPDWPQLLEVLPEDGIRLVHVNPFDEEIKDFMEGSGILARMLSDLGNKLPYVPAILEVTPRITTPSNVVVYLSRIRTYVQQHLG